MKWHAQACKEYLSASNPTQQYCISDKSVPAQTFRTNNSRAMPKESVVMQGHCFLNLTNHCLVA